MEKFIDITLEPVSEAEIANLKREQDIEHLKNILSYVRYRVDREVTLTDWGVKVYSINPDGDWFYYVETLDTEDMVTYWCYDDSISKEIDSPEVAARGMYEYIEDYLQEKSIA